VDVVPVRSPRDLERFIRYPYWLYRNDPMWVAPLPSDEKARLSPGKNPYFDHAEAAYFLAVANGRVVGRGSASTDRNHDSFHGERQATFGFFEAGSAEAAAAILREVETWAGAKGAEVLRGPMSFTTNDECGLLVDGFDHPPALLMPYNRPEYAAWIEAGGYARVRDLYSFRVPVPERPLPAFARAAQAVRRRENVTTRPIDMKRFEEELGRVKEVYNAAWERNWGFVPMTDAEIDHMARHLKPAVVPSIIRIAEVEGCPVGFLLIIPDVNVALRPLRGRLVPFGIFRLLWSLPRLRQGRLMALGIKREWQRRGIAPLLVEEISVETRRLGYTHCEVGWTLEENDLVNGLIRDMGGVRSAVYRVYEKRLTP
jgi:GNAT superfamily N-acetyltransferase